MKNAKRRSIWKFVCNSCGTEEHITVVRKRASKGMCLKCLKINPKQLRLLDSILVAGNPIPYSSNISQGLDLQGNKIAGGMQSKHINL
jgi:hypothetical protein